MKKKKKVSRRQKTPAQIAYLTALGAHIKRVRTAKGYSQDRLYLEAGFSRANMTRIEKGEVDPQASTLKKIADTIGVPIKKLFDFE